MMPAVRGLEELYGEWVNFATVDVGDDSSRSLYSEIINALEYNWRVRPGIYVLDPEGNILGAWAGPVDGVLIQEVIVAALAEFNR